MKLMVIILLGTLVLVLPLSSYGDTKKKRSEVDVEMIEKQVEHAKKQLQNAEKASPIKDNLQETADGRIIEKSTAKAKQKDQPEDDYLKTIQRKSSESGKKKLK